MTGVVIAVVLSAVLLVASWMLGWRSGGRWIGDSAWPRTTDATEGRVQHAHVDDAGQVSTVGVSIPCANGDHHLCRPDRDPCACTCQHGGFDQAVAS